MNLVILILTILLTLSTLFLVYYSVNINGNAKKRFIAKVLSSGLFVLIGVCASFMVYNNISKQYILFILLGGIFSFLGDFFLGVSYNKKKTMKNKSFVIGGASFFLAQVCFTIAFMNANPYHIWLVVFPVLSFFIVFIGSKLPQFKFDGKLLVILAGLYAAMNVLTFTSGLNILIDYSFTDSISFIALGCLLFLISDFLLMYRYFTHKAYKLVTIIYIVTYFAAEFIYMISPLLVK